MWARLKHICTMAAGKAKSTDQIKTEPFDGCYPCFGGNGIRGYVDEYNQDGVFSIIGRQGALCGNINIASGKFYATEHAVVTTLYDGIDFNWSNYTLEALRLNEYATGAAQPGLSVANVLNVFVPVPPTDEQKQIGVKIAESIKVIESIDQEKLDLQATVTKAKSKILDLAIRGQLVPQDPNDEPASVLLERIRAEKEELIRQDKIKRDKKESVIFRGEDNSYYIRQDTHTESIDEQFVFELPDNWEWCSLRNIAKIELGKTLDRAKNTGTNYPYLRSINVRWNEVDLSDLKEMQFEPEELDRYTVRQNDLLICEGGDVGRSCVWTDDKEILYQNALHRVRFYGECNPFYFMYHMMYYESRGIIKSLCKGVTIKHLTGNVLSLIPFALPPLEEQSRIVEKLDQIFALIEGIISD